MTSEQKNRFVAATHCLLPPVTDDAAFNAKTIFGVTKRMQTAFGWSDDDRRDIYERLCDRNCIPGNMR